MEGCDVPTAKRRRLAWAAERTPGVGMEVWTQKTPPRADIPACPAPPCAQWSGLSQWRRLLADSFLEAARQGDTSRLLALRAAGAATDAEDAGGRRALHLASAGGHLAAVQWLRTDSSSVLIRDKQGLTPLEHAYAGGHAAVVEWLRTEASVEDQHMEIYSSVCLQPMIFR